MAGQVPLRGADWIVPDKIVYKTVRKPEYVLDGCFKQAFNALLSKRVLMNINEDMLQNGANAYSMTEFFNDLNRNVMGAIPTDPTMAIYKRVEQKAYVNTLCALMKGDAAGMAMIERWAAARPTTTET